MSSGLKRISQRARVLVVMVVALIIVLVLRQAPVISSARVTQIAPPGTYRIDHLIDGDTVAVDMDGHVESVHLLGVDTPKTAKPNKSAQCYGSEASVFVRDAISKSPVRLVADTVSDNRDRLGRLVRYVYLSNGKLLNQEIIEQGYGFAYNQYPFSKQNSFSEAENEAKAAKRGLWSSCQAV